MFHRFDRGAAEDAHERPMTFFDPLLDETHLAVRDLARNFALKEIRPHAETWEEAGTYPRELHLTAAKAGLLGIAVPEEAGGSGGGWWILSCRWPMTAITT